MHIDSSQTQWLHYLLDKLIHSKRLRKPVAPKKKIAKEAASPAPLYTELECYFCIVEVEGILRDVIGSIKRASTAKKGRRKTQQATVKSTFDGPSSAGDVLGLARERGWVDE